MYPIVYPISPITQDAVVLPNSHTNEGFDNLKDARERRLCIIYDKPAWFQISDNHALTPAEPVIDRATSTTYLGKAIHLTSQMYGVDRYLIQAIVMMETTSCFEVWPDPMRSYRPPMAVTYDMWEEIAGSEEYIKDPINNVEIGGLILSRIQQKIKDPSVAKIASIYHQLDATVVNDYGAKVARLFESLRQIV